MNWQADRKWARCLIVAASVVLIGVTSSCSSPSTTNGTTAISAVGKASLLVPTTITGTPTTTLNPVASVADPPVPMTATPTVQTGPLTSSPQVVEPPRQVTVRTSPQTVPPVTSPPVTTPPVTSPPVTSGPPPAPLGGVAGTVAPGVVDIVGVLANGQGDVAGTGMVMSSSGLVLTNNHVVADSTSFTATEVTTGRTYQAELVGTNPTADVAVLKMVGASGLPTVHFGNSADVYATEPVSSIGNVAGAGVAVVAKGTVVEMDQVVIVADDISGTSEVLSGMILTNTQTVPGDSGGPLFDQGGSVIAMMTACAPGGQPGAPTNEGYAIPINVALGVAEGI